MRNRLIPLPNVYGDIPILEEILEHNDDIITYSFPNEEINFNYTLPIYNEGEEVVGYRELDNLLCVFTNTEAASRATGIDDESLLNRLIKFNKCIFLDWVFYPKEILD